MVNREAPLLAMKQCVANIRARQLRRDQCRRVMRVFVLLLSCWVLCFVIVAASGTSGFAEEPKMLPDIARIAEQGRIVVAVVNKEIFPVVATNENGDLSGLDIDLAKAIAKSLDVTPEFNRESETFDDLVRTVATGRADIGISFLSRTPARAKYVHFTRPYAEQSFVALINRVKGIKYRRKCPSTAELTELARWPGQLGVEENTAHAERVQTALPQSRAEQFPSFVDMMGALFKGDVHVAIGGELVARQFLFQNPGYRIKIDLCELGPRKDDIAIAVRPDAQDLLRYLNIYLQDRDIFFDSEEIINGSAKIY